MATIYIDSEFRCHVSGEPGMVPVDIRGFENKCSQYIEGFRYVPDGEQWVREDGAVFYGPMLSPFVDTQLLDAYQKQYENMMVQMDEAWMEGVNSI